MEQSCAEAFSEADDPIKGTVTHHELSTEPMTKVHCGTDEQGLTCPKCLLLFAMKNYSSAEPVSVIHTPAELRHWFFASRLTEARATPDDGKDVILSPGRNTIHAISLGFMAYLERQAGPEPEPNRLMERSTEMVQLARKLSQAWVDALPSVVHNNLDKVYIDISDSKQSWVRINGMKEVLRLLTRLRNKLARLSGGRVKVEVTGCGQISDWQLLRKQGERIANAGERELIGEMIAMKSVRRAADARQAWIWH